MTKFGKWFFVTIVFAVPAFFLGRVLWPPAAGSPEPTAGQLPFFMLLSLVEALVFGFGIAFLVFGWSIVRALTPAKGRSQAIANFVAIAWLLVSWWPHDNWHEHNGMNLQGLLYIEYVFHVTLMIAGLVLALNFLWWLKKT